MRSSPTTVWVFGGGLIIASDVNQAPDVGVYFNGALELFPGAVGNGMDGELNPVTCTSGNDVALTYNYTDLTFFSSGG